MQNDENKLFMA